MQNEHYPFSLPPLPYPYNSLQPYLDEMTLRFHHDKHFQTYVDNLNAALRDLPEFHTWSLETILRNLDSFPKNVRKAVCNNAGGVYNHALYFESMRPTEMHQPGGSLLYEMQKEFGSFENFKKQFKAAALGQFGSGYAWLCCDNGKLVITTTCNQDTPLDSPLRPLLNVDVWEHAYYLQYQNRRADYLDAWFFLVDWKGTEERYRRK